MHPYAEQWGTLKLFKANLLVVYSWRLYWAILAGSWLGTSSSLLCHKCKPEVDVEWKYYKRAIFYLLKPCPEIMLIITLGPSGMRRMRDIVAWVRHLKMSYGRPKVMFVWQPTAAGDSILIRVLLRLDVDGPFSRFRTAARSIRKIEKMCWKRDDVERELPDTQNTAGSGSLPDQYLTNSAVICAPLVSAVVGVATNNQLAVTFTSPSFFS